MDSQDIPINQCHIVGCKSVARLMAPIQLSSSYHVLTHLSGSTININFCDEHYPKHKDTTFGCYCNITANLLCNIPDKGYEYMCGNVKNVDRTCTYYIQYYDLYDKTFIKGVYPNPQTWVL